MPANTASEPKLETLGDSLSGIATNDPHSIEALDEHFSKLATEKGASEPIPGLRVEPKLDEDKAAVDSKAAADKAAADEKAAAEKAAADKLSAAATQTPEEKAAADKLAAEKAESDAKAATEKAAADKKANELYSDVQLPPNARGQSAQAFASIKARAAADLTQRDNEITKLQTELAKHVEQVKGLVPVKDMEALKTEVEQLRRFKAALDVDADPALKAKFDSRVSTVNDFIYSKLQATGKITAENIEAIKKLGGPEQVNWEPIFKKLEDPQLQRLVQSKLDEIETVKFEKEQALKAAKANVDDYLANRSKEFEGASAQHNEATKQVLASLLSQVPWITPPQVKADATDAEKKAAAEQTAFITDVHKTMSESVADDSPQMRAVLLMGVAQHLNLKRVHAATVAANKTEKDGLTAKVSDLEKQLADANEKIAKFKSGSVTRLRESNAPANTPVLSEKKELVNAADALDAFRASRAA